MQVGSYNALMATTSFQGDDAKYQASKETFESSHEIFRTVFPGGFAWEVQAVYSPPPVVVMKYRHWGVMEGAYKGHAPTGEVVDSVGICIAKVQSSLEKKSVPFSIVSNLILSMLNEIRHSSPNKFCLHDQYSFWTS